ncbi:hypothetical protein BKA62DRAFT_285850 [Auriculariales sp. MPI-PUGE-AT-0066]|nr:hypothetical protein BKA62DRAFT_285850 [Auriculariales sp. MPI-PUGE-AT-0066]
MHVAMAFPLLANRVNPLWDRSFLRCARRADSCGPDLPLIHHVTLPFALHININVLWWLFHTRKGRQRRSQCSSRCRQCRHGMTSHKNESRKLSNEVQRIATCVETSSLRAHHAGRATRYFCPRPLCSHNYKRYIQAMRNGHDEGDRPRHVQAVAKAEKTSTAIEDMSRACDAISDVLMANGNDCGLLEDPTTAGPTLPNEDRRDDLRLEVSGLTPAYDGIKAVILGMVNMTDGLPWPLKAIPQTVLQIVKHVENGMAAAARITELLAEVQSQWELVAEWNGSDIGNERLRPHIEAFFENVFCVFIRLRILHATHPIRRVVGTESLTTSCRKSPASFPRRQRN